MYFPVSYMSEQDEGCIREHTSSQCQKSKEHEMLYERLRKTLYYGKMPSIDRPSLAMTELTVDMLQEIAPRELGKVDMYYASELSREVCVSPCSVVIAMLYMRRVQKRSPAYLRNVTSSELLLVAMMMASKYLYDEGEIEEPLNEEWANSANIDVTDINQLERAFLAAIDWKLYVPRDEFWQALIELETRIAWKKCMERDGSMTYTDLTVLLNNSTSTCACFASLLYSICEVLAVCSLTYCACLIPLITSPHAFSAVQSLSALLLATQVSQLFPGLASVPSQSPTHHVSILPGPMAGSWLSVDAYVAEWGVLPVHPEEILSDSENLFAGVVTETSRISRIDSRNTQNENVQMTKKHEGVVQIANNSAEVEAIINRTISLASVSNKISDVDSVANETAAVVSSRTDGCPTKLHMQCTKFRCTKEAQSKCCCSRTKVEPDSHRTNPTHDNTASKAAEFCCQTCSKKVTTADGAEIEVCCTECNTDDAVDAQSCLSCDVSKCSRVCECISLEEKASEDVFCYSELGCNEVSFDEAEASVCCAVVGAQCPCAGTASCNELFKVYNSTINRCHVCEGGNDWAGGEGRSDNCNDSVGGNSSVGWWPHQGTTLVVENISKTSSNPSLWI